MKRRRKFANRRNNIEGGKWNAKETRVGHEKTTDSKEWQERLERDLQPFERMESKKDQEGSMGTGIKLASKEKCPLPKVPLCISVSVALPEGQ